MHAIIIPCCKFHNFMMLSVTAMRLSQQVRIGVKSMLAEDELGQPMLTRVRTYKTFKYHLHKNIIPVKNLSQ